MTPLNRILSVLLSCVAVLLLAQVALAGDSVTAETPFFAREFPEGNNLDLWQVIALGRSTYSCSSDCEWTGGQLYSDCFLTDEHHGKIDIEPGQNPLATLHHSTGSPGSRWSFIDEPTEVHICDSVDFSGVPNGGPHSRCLDGSSFEYRAWIRAFVTVNSEMVGGPLYSTFDKESVCGPLPENVKFVGEITWVGVPPNPLPELSILIEAGEPSGPGEVWRQDATETFEFPKRFMPGWVFEVIVANAPGGSECFIEPRVGTVGAEDIEVAITCGEDRDILYQVSGLKKGQQITLDGSVTVGSDTTSSQVTTGNVGTSEFPGLTGVTGANWRVEVSDEPEGIKCRPEASSGIFNGEIPKVTIVCGDADESTVGVSLSNLFEGSARVAIDAELPDGSAFSDEIFVEGSEIGTFSRSFPPKTAFSVRVTSQPPPPGELFDETECSLPSGTMTLGEDDVVVNGQCENHMFSRPDLCDLVPSLCIVFGTDPIEFSCLGGTLVYSYLIPAGIVCVDVWDPNCECLIEVCESRYIEGSIKRDFLICDINGPTFADSAKGIQEPVELEGPYASIGVPHEGEVVSGVVPVFGYLMDQGSGIDTAYFALDGELVELDSYQTGLDNSGLCDELPAEFGPCLANSRFSGQIDSLNLSNGIHELELIGVNNDNPQGFTLVSRRFVVDNDVDCDSDSTKPSITLTAPPDGAVLEEGAYTLTADASDASGILKVAFFVDGIRQGTADFTAPYSQVWNAMPGAHEIKARAIDNCDNRKWTPVHTVTVDGGEPCDTDITGPSVFVTAPTEGSNHPVGNLSVSASANDPNDVESVQFYVDGNLVAVDFDEPYQRTWSATVGDHTIQAGAFDLCGNESLSAPVGFEVGGDPCDDDTTGPTVSLTSPQNGAFLPLGTHPITASAADPGGIQNVAFYIDGVLVSSDTSAPYSYDWDATPGAHTLQVMAYDNCGNVTSTPPISVTIDPGDPCYTDVTGPTLELITPAGGSTHDVGNVAMAASASDPNGVESVQFYVDGNTVAVDFAAPYSAIWNASVEGAYSVHVGAFDQCGNETLTEPVTVNIVEADPCETDTSGPTVSLTSPQNGAELPFGFNPITASASDANGVERVEFYVDGALAVSDNSSPYSHNWNAGLGQFTLQAKAYDTCGNDRLSSPVSVTVVSTSPCQSDVTGPSISLSAPGNGSTQEAGNVAMTAIANDPNGVESVQFYVDGAIEAVDFAAPYSRNWVASVGSYTLQAGGFDLCGNEAFSAPITVTIVEPDPCAGDTAGPTVSITEPGHNSLHEPGTVTILASASDPGGVQKVEFYVDDVLKSTDLSAPYSWFWGDGTIGWHSLKVRAFDNCGNNRWSSVIDVELGPTGPEDPPEP